MITKQLLLGMIACLSEQHQVDPYLVAAVVKTESSWQVDAIGSIGELGLMQLRPEFFSGDLKDGKTNLTLGVEFLSSLTNRCSHLNEQAKWEHAYVICFNTGVRGSYKINDPAKFSYLVKVKGNYETYKAKELFGNVACNKH
jgi:soluble lytic murein transglycosylase-like protein